MEINPTNIHRRTVAGVPVLHVRAAVTKTNCSGLDDLVADLLSENVPGMIIDLSDADFIDSTGISILLACKKHADAANVLFVLCNVHPYIADIVDKLNLITIFICAADERQAVALIKNQKT